MMAELLNWPLGNCNGCPVGTNECKRLVSVSSDGCPPCDAMTLKDWRKINGQEVSTT